MSLTRWRWIVITLQQVIAKIFPLAVFGRLECCTTKQKYYRSSAKMKVEVGSSEVSKEHSRADKKVADQSQVTHLQPASSGKYNPLISCLELTSSYQLFSHLIKTELTELYNRNNERNFLIDLCQLIAFAFFFSISHNFSVFVYPTSTFLWHKQIFLCNNSAIVSFVYELKLD